MCRWVLVVDLVSLFLVGGKCELSPQFGGKVSEYCIPVSFPSLRWGTDSAMIKSYHLVTSVWCTLCSFSMFSLLARRV